MEVLNLSMNPDLSGATMKYLRCFKNLQLVDLSGYILLVSAFQISLVEHFSYVTLKCDSVC